MENNKTLYKSQTYNSLKAFMYVFPIYVLLTGLIIVIFRKLHMPGLGVLGWIIISSAPFIFQTRFKEIFTQNIELTFDEQSFLIQEYAIKSGYLTKELVIYWAEMNSFKCSFSSGVTYISISLSDGSTNSLSFKDERTQEQIINERSVFSLFYYYISLYNSNEKQADKITLQPGFLTTTSGTQLLYGLTAIAIIIQIVLAPSSFMLSIMSFFIIIGLLLKRRTDKNLYDKLSQLEPKSPTD